MPTTTIRIPEELKAPVVAAAERSGTSTHNFILEAILEKTELDNLQVNFDLVAEERYGGIVATGKTIPWHEMREYLESRLSRNEVSRPVARQLNA
ncbi:CopG family transcriptional regulator [Polynucleobacter rarus]|uniref:CopG family transcriptional regulator n=1 Tax=Polynucleobacter rarus TaxID=556055 RepID=UPI000D3E1A06|nr:CopG family transcriptional regulator [Polynucleobacter rarus]